MSQITKLYTTQAVLTHQLRVVVLVVVVGGVLKPMVVSQARFLQCWMVVIPALYTSSNPAQLSTGRYLQTAHWVLQHTVGQPGDFPGRETRQGALWDILPGLGH